MKIKNKKYLLGFSLLIFFAIGGFLEKPLMTWLYPPIFSVHSIVITRDINVYTQSADAIVVGEVVEVSDPYFREGTQMIQRDVMVNVDEVLKGDEDMTDVTLIVEGGQIGRKRVIMEDGVRLTEGEKVLLFLGTNSDDEYVVFAGPYGKYLIDENDEVSSIGDFVMALDDLKAEIADDLENGERIPVPEKSELIVQQ